MRPNRRLDEIALDFADLRSPQGGVIPASRLCCINLSGNDYRGQPMHPQVSVPQGKVQALWCGVDVPRDAAPGEYQGVVTVRAKNAEPTPVRLVLSIGDQVREDRGDGEPWRHSRIRWLNSTLGIDDQPVAPYTPLVVEGRTIRCLGREVQLASTGLPAQIRCGGRDLLAGPMALHRRRVATARDWMAGGEPKFVKQTAGAVEWQSQNTAGPLAVRVPGEHGVRRPHGFHARRVKPRKRSN